MNDTPKAALSMTVTSNREIVMTRAFDAPRALVWRAYTDPTLIPRWWGLRDNVTTVDRLDARPGGQWRFVERAPDGTEHGFRGEFREVAPPERLVYTFEYEPMPGHVVVDTVTLEERDGRTTVTIRAEFQSREDRDGMIQSGMEYGANESMNRLDELLATL